MCPEYSWLYMKWVMVATPIDGEIGERERRILDADRRNPKYVEAREQLIDHIKECKECRRMR